MKQLAKFLGYSDQLDASVKSVYLITTLIVGTLLGWLALAVFVLHAYDAVPSSMAIIASFMMIYGMLKQRYFFAAKSLLLLLSFTQMVFFYFALQLSKYYARLKLASEVDSLTGLFNRRSFTETAAKRFYNGNTSPFALAVFDIDDFKHVNDTWGHPVGDIVLKEMASVIKNHLRTSDFFARIGGEEFALILDVGEIASNSMSNRKSR